MKNAGGVAELFPVVLGAVGADAVAEFGLGLFLEIEINFLPVAIVVEDVFAG